MTHESALYTRLISLTISKLIRAFPAVMINGPGASGKTTTCLPFSNPIVRRNDPDRAVVYKTYPDQALTGLDSPILLDEWQAVPQVLGAVKRIVDTEADSGLFLLTGSALASLRRQGF